MLHTEKRGSVSLEAALVIPVILAFFMFLYGVFYTFLLYNCVSDAMYKTADFASDYGILYHENGIVKFSDSLTEKIGDKLNISEILQFGDDILYTKIFEKHFRDELESNAIYKKFFKDNVLWDFGKSSFFNGNEDICLNGCFKLKYKLPFFENLINGFSFEKKVKVRAFINGKTPDFSKEKTDSVWSLSNFERGKKIQQEFGRNLPEFFPILDYYENGTAKVIVSINHTLKTYENEIYLRMKLQEVLDSIIVFSGGSYGGTTIEKEQIASKKIVLVFPKDDFSATQKNVVNEFVKIANSKGVSVVVERFEYTNLPSD